MSKKIVETPRMNWPFMEWNADWQAWQQKFEDLVMMQDSDVFANLEGREKLFKQIPNASIIDDSGTRKLHIASDVILVSRTLNTAVNIDSSSDLVLSQDSVIGAVVTPGAVGPQDTIFEVYSSVDKSPDIRVFGYVDSDLNIIWFNGAKLSYGDSARPIFSFLATGGSDTNRVMVTSADTTPNFLRAKLQSTDSSVVITTATPGGNETVNLSVPGVGTDELVKASAADTTAGYVGDKVRGRAGIKLSVADKGSGDLAIDFEYGDDHTILVERDSSALVSGQRLLAAVAAAKTITPLDIDNRVKIELLPGKYEIASSIVMDTDFIDIVCSSEAQVPHRYNGDYPMRQHMIAAGAVIAWTGTLTALSVTSGDNIFRGLTFKAPSDQLSAISLNCSDTYSVKGARVGFIGCYFNYAGVFFNDGDFGGSIIRCSANTSIGGADDTFKGTAIDVSCSARLFSGNLDSAYLCGCSGGMRSFAGHDTSPATRNIKNSILVNCQSAIYGFASGKIEFSRLLSCVGDRCYWGGTSGIGAELVGCNGSSFQNIGTDEGWDGSLVGCRFVTPSIMAPAASSRHLKVIGSTLLRGNDPYTQVGYYSISALTGGSSGTVTVVGSFLQNAIGPGIKVERSEQRRTNGSPPAEWESDIWLGSMSTDDDNGASLVNALAYAATMEPGGNARSATNRVTIHLESAGYKILGSGSSFELGSDHDFIDIVGNGSAGKENWDNIPYRGDISKPLTRIYVEGDGLSALFTTEDVTNIRFSNIHFDASGDTTGNTACLSMGADSDFKNCVFENCVFEGYRASSNISAVSQASPCVVTSSTSLSLGRYASVYISGVEGMTELTDGMYEAKGIGSSQMELRRVDSSSFTAYTSGGSVEFGGQDVAPCIIFTSGSGVVPAGRWVNCHFVGQIVVNGLAFEGSVVNCSFYGDALTARLKGALVDNCRFADSALASGSPYVDSDTVIKNTKLWGGKGPGVTGIFSPTMIDVEFFGEQGLGVSSVLSAPKMIRVKALSLNHTLHYSAGAYLSQCELYHSTYTPLISNVETARSVSGITQQSSTVTRFTTTVAHGFVEGDRIVFDSFSNSSGGMAELNGQCLTVSNVPSTMTFDVVLHMSSNYTTPYASPYPGYCAKHGIEIYDSKLSIAMDTSVEAGARQPVLQGGHASGYTVKGCRFGYGPVFDAASSTINRIVLVDCSSYDNDLFFPSKYEGRIKVKGEGASSAVERGKQFVDAVRWATKMLPKNRMERDSVSRATVELGPVLYDLGTMDYSSTTHLTFGSGDGYIDIVGVGNVVMPSGDDGFPLRDKVVSPGSVVRAATSTPLFDISAALDLGFYNVSFEDLENDLGSAFVRSTVAGRMVFKDVSMQQKVVTYAITGITQANPAVVTMSGGHSASNGDLVYISGVGGMTELNNRWFRVLSVTGTTFALKDENSAGYSAFTSGGTAALRSSSVVTLATGSKLLADNCYFDGSVSVSGLVDSRVKDCVINGAFVQAGLARSVIDGVKVAGPVFAGSGTIDADSIVKGCLFGVDSIVSSTVIAGRLQDCVGLHNFLCSSGVSTGYILRCEASRNHDSQAMTIGASGVVEDVKVIMKANRGAFTVSASGAKFRRVVVEDEAASAMTAHAIVAASAVNAEVSFSELRLGLGSNVTNLLTTAYNITT